MIQLTDKFISMGNYTTIKAGFKITFENGYTISVQFGYGNYCSNIHESKDNCDNVEVAVFNPEGGFHRLPRFTDDDVKGWVSMDELADIMHEVKTLKP